MVVYCALLDTNCCMRGRQGTARESLCPGQDHLRTELIHAFYIFVNLIYWARNVIKFIQCYDAIVSKGKISNSHFRVGDRPH